jgi:hypothetical protein
MRRVDSSRGQVVTFRGGLSLDYETLLRDGCVGRFVLPSEAEAWRRVIRTLGRRDGQRVRTRGAELEDWQLGQRRRIFGTDDLGDRTYRVFAYLLDREPRFARPEPDPEPGPPRRVA